ncbi:hypothetical protein C8R43DRAFT_959719 [Mycena crocata]|nr:hypothetical protein C8R43DRAFT_959719 [Mycena crocata]
MPKETGGAGKRCHPWPHRNKPDTTVPVYIHANGAEIHSSQVYYIYTMCPFSYEYRKRGHPPQMPKQHVRLALVSYGCKDLHHTCTFSSLHCTLSAVPRRRPVDLARRPDHRASRQPVEELSLVLEKTSSDVAGTNARTRAASGVRSSGVVCVETGARGARRRRQDRIESDGADGNAMSTTGCMGAAQPAEPPKYARRATLVVFFRRPDASRRVRAPPFRRKYRVPGMWSRFAHWDVGAESWRCGVSPSSLNRVHSFLWAARRERGVISGQIRRVRRAHHPGVACATIRRRGDCAQTRFSAAFARLRIPWRSRAPKSQLVCGRQVSTSRFTGGRNRRGRDFHW